jgi:hypothetical protein
VILALISAIAAIVVIPQIGDLWNTKDKAKLEIVDISLQDVVVFQPNDQTYNVNSYLDIKLRNTSGEVAFVKEIEVTVEKSYLLDLYAACALGGVPVSEYYDIELPIQATSVPISKELSQSIPLDGVDRFVVYLNKPIEEVSLPGSVFQDRFRVYQIEVKLLYNTDDFLASQKLILISPSLDPGCSFIIQESVGNDNPPEIFNLSDRDTKFMLDIDRVDGKKSKLIQRLIRIAKGECYFVSPFTEWDTMYCSGQYINIRE